MAIREGIVIRTCRCGHRNHRTGVGADVPAGCRWPECQCAEPDPVACSLTGWPERWECGWCRERLPKGRRRWCRGECERQWQRNHVWAMARPAAIDRDGEVCVVCGRGAGVVEMLLGLLELARPGSLRTSWYGSPAHRELERWSDVPLEVNHIEPRRGQGYLAGCHHHQDNLETLCRPHHVAVTAAQRRGWSGSARLLLLDSSAQLSLVGLVGS